VYYKCIPLSYDVDAMSTRDPLRPPVEEAPRTILNQSTLMPNPLAAR
jgi:hypothetical protein